MKKVQVEKTAISKVPLWQVLISYTFIFLGQLFVYWPVLTRKFLLPDDYEYMYEGLIHSDRFTVQAIAQARLFNAFVAQTLAWIGRMDDMWIIRTIGLLGIFALGICLFHAFKKYGQNIFLSAFFALLITIMPAFQEYASWAVLFMAPWAAVIAYFAFLSLEKAWLVKKLPRVLWIALSIFLLVIAYNIHPTSATFIAVFITIFFLYQKHEKRLQQTLFFLIMSGLGAVAHFIVYKIYLLLLNTPALARAALINDPFEKLIWFVFRPLLKALNLIYIPPSGWVAIVVGITITAGLMLHFVQEKQKKDIAINSIFIVLLILLSYSSNLIIDENLANYRTLLALTGVITVIAIVALQSFIKLLKLTRFKIGIFALITLGCLAFARIGYTNLLIIPMERGLQEMRTALSTFSDEKYDRIVFTFTNNTEYKDAVRHDYKTLALVSLYEIDPIAFEKISVEIAPLGSVKDPRTFVIHVQDFTPIP